MRAVGRSIIGDRKQIGASARHPHNNRTTLDCPLRYHSEGRDLEKQNNRSEAEELRRRHQLLVNTMRHGVFLPSKGVFLLS